MLLAIDIGNTNITSALFKGKRITKQFDIPIKTYSKLKFIKKLPDKLKLSACVICSVVPKVTKIIRQDLKFLTGKTPYIIGKDLAVPIKNRYRKPKQLGQDRLVNAYAATKLYPTPAIVIDSGTAITFDIISKRKEYLGGFILPGMEMSLSALKEKTALLPQLKLKTPEKFIGVDTKSSIIGGVVFGTAALTKELINMIERKTGKKTLIIGTGGNINLIKKYSGIKIEIDQDLTLKGISLIYNDIYPNVSLRASDSERSNPKPRLLRQASPSSQ